MKRVFDEISDEEWENHKFATSRVFRQPSIESFAYVPVKRKETDQTVFDLEEDEEDEEAVVVRATQRGGRTRRFVVDEDSDVEASPEVVEIRSTGEEDEDFELSAGVASEEGGDCKETDLVGIALQKCGEISASLKQELYGSSVTSCESYAEVDSSAARIVTQVRIFLGIYI